MLCPNCQTKILLSDTLFCRKCGARIGSTTKTPDIKEHFAQLKRIRISTGTKINIVPTMSNVSTLIIKAPEAFKNAVQISLFEGVLQVKGPDPEPCETVEINGVTITDNYFKRITVDGVPLFPDNNIEITLKVGFGVSIAITSTIDVECNIGDVRGEVTVLSNGKCKIDCGKVPALTVNSVGDLDANVKMDGLTYIFMTHGNCVLKTEGSSTNMFVEVEGNADLAVDSSSTTSHLIVGGNAKGHFRAKQFEKLRLAGNQDDFRIL